MDGTFAIPAPHPFGGISGTGSLVLKQIFPTRQPAVSTILVTSPINADVSHQIAFGLLSASVMFEADPRRSDMIRA